MLLLIVFGVCATYACCVSEPVVFVFPGFGLLRVIVVWCVGMFITLDFDCLLDL